MRKSPIFCRKLEKITEICDHNIVPWPRSYISIQVYTQDSAPLAGYFYKYPTKPSLVFLLHMYTTWASVHTLIYYGMHLRSWMTNSEVCPNKSRIFIQRRGCGGGKAENVASGRFYNFAVEARGRFFRTTFKWQFINMGLRLHTYVHNAMT
jgi:hypothetical protein